jgi:hypothetical protein
MHRGQQRGGPLSAGTHIHPHRQKEQANHGFRLERLSLRIELADGRVVDLANRSKVSRPFPKREVVNGPAPAGWVHGEEALFRCKGKERKGNL